MARTEETILLLTALRKFHEQNLTATYEELEKVLPGCSTKYRNHLTSALRIAKDEYGMLFTCVLRVGYKPLDNESKVIEIEKRRLGKIHSQARYMEDELNTVAVTKLSDTEQQRYYSAHIKLSFHKMVLDDRLKSQFAIAGQKCCNAGKIDFSPSDFQDALKALT